MNKFLILVFIMMSVNVCVFASEPQSEMVQAEYSLPSTPLPEATIVPIEVTVMNPNAHNVPFVACAILYTNVDGADKMVNIQMLSESVAGENEKLLKFGLYTPSDTRNARIEVAILSVGLERGINHRVEDTGVRSQD